MVTNKRRKAQTVSNDTNINLNVHRTALSVAVAAALPGAAIAQDNDEVIEEIVTIGVRTSILDSVNSKRMADSIADVVDAGALGYLPDASIADSLGRVPGVTTVRDSGQSSELNIRGMNGDFIQTTLNGREQASTAGYSAGTRWMSFDQYPAELINQAAVFKSPMASQLEGGVAGIVELKTVDPLSAPNEHNVVLNARLSRNDAASDFGGDEMAIASRGLTRASLLTTRSALQPASPYWTSRTRSSCLVPVPTIPIRLAMAAMARPATNFPHARSSGKLARVPTNVSAR